MSRGRDRQIGSEVTLALVTVAVVVGFDRLFSSGNYLGPLLVAAVVGHTAAAVTRRTLSAGLAQVAMLVIGFLVAAWTCLTDTLRFGIPRGLTLHRTSLDLRAAWHGLGNELAPTHATGASCWRRSWRSGSPPGWPTASPSTCTRPSSRSCRPPPCSCSSRC